MAQAAATSPPLDVKSDDISGPLATQVQGEKLPQPVRGPSGSDGFPKFRNILDDAMLLLTYAAETGIEVDDSTRTAILNAKAAPSHDWNYPGAGNLLAALSTLAAKLKPITADSLRASSSNSVNPEIRSFRWWTCILTVPIVLFSVLSFVSSSISNALRTDITTANELVVKLRAELGTPNAPTAGTPEKPALPAGLNQGEILTQLQQYASTVRAIDARARRLNWFVLNTEHDPYAKYRWNLKSSPQERAENQQIMRAKFQLPIPLVNMPQALDALTITLQDVRSFGQDIADLVAIYYGAVTACLLPILYALLGTCAYLLRIFEDELRTLTFVPSSKTHWARFLIAGIGGAVVGLFNFVMTQGASISPLAIAFLVGYAVDVFFSFLEGLLQAFTKSKNTVSSPVATLSVSR
jgi:hypothetical protein